MLDIYSLVRQIKLLSILMVYRIKIYPMHSTRKKLLVYCIQGSQKRCHLSLLTNSAFVILVQMRGEGGVAGSQPMSAAVHIT
jgi:hypothetical protein